jgi:DNA-binding MarR family transcriptional regulator
MDSTLVQLIQHYELYQTQLKDRTETESLGGFVLYMNRQLGELPQNGIDFGIESWENFDRQTLSEMATALIGKMGRYVDFYSKKSMPKTMLGSIEEFTYLIVLLSEKSLSKTELIYQNGHQITTGTEIIKRLLNKGFVVQRKDNADKRSVLVSITELGKAAIYSAATTTKQIATIATNLLSDEELIFLVNLLRKLDDFHDSIFRESRNTDFEEIATKLTLK